MGLSLDPGSLSMTMVSLKPEISEISKWIDESPFIQTDKNENKANLVIKSLTETNFLSLENPFVSSNPMKLC